MLYFGVYVGIIDNLKSYVFLVKVTLQYTAANWRIYAVENLTGSRYSQTASPSGAYLTGVSVTAPLSGSGTLSSPVKIVNDAAATITEIDTGSLAALDTVIPTSKAVKTYTDDSVLVAIQRAWML
mgnify:CR=1 FL=1